MGLQCQLNDLSSDSIPLILFSLIAACVNHIRSFFLHLLHSVGLHGSPHIEDGLTSSSLGTGLATLILLTQQLNINHLFSYSYRCCGGEGSDCVVCLCRLKDGDQVRKLDCHHVFHKDCFDGWLDYLNFNCPLCRSPLVSDECISLTEGCAGGELVAWFSLQ